MKFFVTDTKHYITLFLYNQQMNRLNLEINTQKNLLAFSAGVDSTALFFLMLDQNIAFDIAIVDYNQRVQSKEEVIYATQLAHKYNKKCFISSYPEDLKFSEKDARDFRYSFFDEIMIRESYESLLTAHQLNDKLEWFLMQFTKGAGLTELIGMESIVEKNNYKILKPLLPYSKSDLQTYLDDLEIKYFVDHSNYDEKYKRNYFRHHFSDQLLEQFSKGISNSFQYLEEDNRSLFKGTKEKRIEELSLFKFNGDLNIALKLIDKDLKRRGILLSKSTRDEIKEKKEVVVSHKIAIAILEDTIYIVPYFSFVMDKKFKEKCRVENIPKNIRSYIFKLQQEGISIF